jgi:hypothetical protein
MSGGQTWGFDSIGAVATEKHPATSLTTGMPSAYASVYSAQKRPERYFVEYVSKPETFWSGDDFQSLWHEQKMKDAHYMANAKVRATTLHNIYAETNPHGYKVPKPVLGQRKYANPSNGNQAIYFPRPSPSYEGGSDGELVGGVLRTAVGQAYGKSKLNDRVAQLNQIAEAKQLFQLSAPTSMATPAERMAAPRFAEVGSEVELNLLLQSVLDAIAGSDGGEHLSSFAYNDATRALSLMFRLVPEKPEEVIDDTLQKVNPILDNLRSLLDPDVAPSRNQQVAMTLYELFERIEKYLKGMEEGRNRPINERIALSKNLVRSLGFAKMMRSYDYESSHLRANASSVSARQAAMDLEHRREDEGFDDEAPTREDEQHSEQTGARRTRSSRPMEDVNRQAFGANAGAFFDSGGPHADARQFFDAGEEEGEEEEEEEEEEEAASRSAARSSARSASVRSHFDPDTQEFNVATGAPAETGSPSIKIRRPAAARAPAKVSFIPKSRYDLPSTREGFIDLAHKLNTHDKILINIYGNSSIQNIRRNFIKRLGL